MRRYRLLLTWFLLFPGNLFSQDQQKPILTLDTGGHTGRIWDVVFTPSGQELITVSYDKTIRIWDVPSGKAVRTLRPPIGPGNEGRLIGVALSPDGQTLATAGTGVAGSENAVYVISLASGQITRVLRGHQAPVNTLAFSPDGKLLASAANDRSGRLWELASGACSRVLDGHEHDNVNCITFSRDGKHVGTAGADQTARLWSVETGLPQQVLRHQGQVPWMAFAPDGTSLATVAGSCVCLWNPDGTLREKHDTGSQLNFCQFLPDSRQVFFVGGTPGFLDVTSKTMRRFNETTGVDGASELQSRFQLVSLERKLRALSEMTGGAVSPDGSHAMTVDAAGTLYRWRTADGILVQRLTAASRPVASVAWSRDARFLAFGSAELGIDVGPESFPLTRSFHLAELDLAEVGDTDFHQVAPIQSPFSLEPIGDTFRDERWSTKVAVKQRGQLVRVLVAPNARTGDQRVSCVALVDATHAVVGNRNGGLYLFDLSTGTLERAFRGHVGEIWAVAPSQDGRYLLSGSNDHTLRIWELNKSDPLLSLLFAGSDWIAWTPEGYYACSPGGERLVGWHVNSGPDQMAVYYAATQFRNSLYRPDVIKRLLQTGSVEKALELADQARGTKSKLVQVAEVLPPLVVITSPDQPQSEVQEPTVQLRFVVKPVGRHPITAVRLLLDGRPAPSAEHLQRFDPPRDHEVREGWTVKLEPGRHALAVIAETAVSKGTSDAIEVGYGARGLVRDDAQLAETEQKSQRPSLYVLAVGISDYPDGLKLNYAAKDAQAFAAVCEKHSARLYRKVEVKLIVDKDATRRNVLGGLTWLRKQITQNDVGIVFFAGHGGKEVDSSLFLFPVDIEREDLLSTGVPGDQLKKTLAGIPGRFVVLLDACHSGGIDGERRRAGDSLTDELVRDLGTDEAGVIVMCSSTGREYSLESSAVQHGFFTLALVEGLAGKAQKSTAGAVYLHHLDAYVTDRVKELSKGRQHPVTNRANLRSFPMSQP